MAVQPPVDARAWNAAALNGAICLQFDGSETDIENVGRCGGCGSAYTMNLLVEGVQYPDGTIERVLRVLGWAEEHRDVDNTLHAVLSSDGARLGSAGHYSTPLTRSTGSQHGDDAAFDSLSLPKARRVSAGRELSPFVIKTGCTNVFPQLDGCFLLFRKSFESPLAPPG